MKELFQLNGIVPVLNTPFTNSDQVDIKALEGHVLEALQAGVAGFLVPAMASEVYKLTRTEKLTIVACVLEVTTDRVPVFVGTASPSVSESLKLMKTYQELGCKNFLVQFPFRDDNQFQSDFLRLMEPDPRVVMLQDWDATGYGLPDELILKLFEEVPAFRCLKVETVPAGVKYSRMIDQTNGTLHVSGGWAVMQMIEGLHRGVHAFMTTGMHYFYTEIYRKYADGETAFATKLFNELLPVLAFSNQHLDVSVHFFKRLLWRQGIYSTPKVREPILPFDHVHQDFADQLIERVIQKERHIKRSRQGY